MLLIDTAILHPSAKHVAGKDWNNLWDKALDHGPKGTKQLQRVILVNQFLKILHVLCAGILDKSY